MDLNRRVIYLEKDVAFLKRSIESLEIAVNQIGKDMIYGRIDEMNFEDVLIEKLAELHHEIWIEWSKKLAETEKLSPERLERWKELWKSYKSLTNEQKEQDRKYARQAMTVFKNVAHGIRG
jgi:RPA family protein